MPSGLRSRWRGASRTSSVTGSLGPDDADRATLASRASGAVSAGRDSASRWFCGSNEKASRDTSGFLLVLSRSRHFDLTALKLSIKVRQLTARIFKQEFSL